MVFFTDLSVCIFVGFCTIVCVTCLCRFLETRKRKTVNDASSSRSGHLWTPIEINDHGFYCACCGNNLTTGYECDFCTLKVDSIHCLRNIISTIKCKAKTISAVQDSSDFEDAQETVNHHWIPGNIDQDRFCAVCNELCGGGVGLQDFRCSWCKIVVHTTCCSELSHICDFGPYKPFVIPPSKIITRKTGHRTQRSHVISSIEPIDGLKPVFVLINPKSGSGAGLKTIRKFRSFLHPLQVVNITKSNLKATLNWMDNYPHIDIRILVAGGDGTISSVLDDIDNLRVSRPVALFPLGTGNDLSRVIGWGKEQDSTFEVLEWLELINKSSLRKIDRWSVDIVNNRKLGVNMFNKRVNMTNYVSIGVDARVTLGMQNTRDAIPKVIKSRLTNKLLFFTYGTKDVFEHSCKGLEKKLQLFLDDSTTAFDLPTIEGLVFLNIPAWGAGVKPWKDAPEHWPQRIDDKKFEIFAVSSSFHIAQLQVGLSTPIYIGQAKKAVVKIENGTLPMQSDGEAWKQRPCIITITHKGQSSILENLEFSDLGASYSQK